MRYICTDDDHKSDPPRRHCTCTSMGTASIDVELPEKPQSSGFFSLPMEIRIMIFRLVIGAEYRELLVRTSKRPSQRHICIPYETRWKSRSGREQIMNAVEAHKNTKSRLAIAFTCRQAYHEDLKIWYTDTRFHIQHQQCMLMFLNEIGASNRNSIRHVRYYRESAQTSFKDPMELLRLAYNHLPGLRDLTFDCPEHDPWVLNDENAWLRMVKWRPCHDELHPLLGIGDRLEFVARHTEYQWPDPNPQTLEKTNEDGALIKLWPVYLEIVILECLSLRRDQNTTEVTSNNSMMENRVGYYVDGPNCTIHMHLTRA